MLLSFDDVPPDLTDELRPFRTGPLTSTVDFLVTVLVVLLVVLFAGPSPCARRISSAWIFSKRFIASCSKSSARSSKSRSVYLSLYRQVNRYIGLYYIE